MLKSLATIIVSSHRLVQEPLDSWLPLEPLDIEYTVAVSDNTSPETVAHSLQDATIVVTSATAITRQTIESAPNLQLVSCNGTGTDHVDKAACRERGIKVCRVPAQNSETVADHVFALYFAVRRKIVTMHALTVGGQTWAAEGMQIIRRLGEPPRTSSEETLVIIGYGSLGTNIERIGRALGMTVLIAERKGAAVARPGRTMFEDALNQGTLFVVVAPLDETTRDMISAPELQAMGSSSIIINAGRGGIINENALADALRGKTIGGAGMDVFTHEPATKDNCSLIDPTIPNLVLTPHMAWYSSKTISGSKAIVKGNIESFVRGEPRNTV